MITETFLTELNKNFSTYGFISLSGETKTDNKLTLISPSNKLKFNLEKDAYKNKIGFELGKVHDQTSFSATRDKKDEKRWKKNSEKRTVVKKEQCRKK